jgi:hypothetical protein
MAGPESAKLRAHQAWVLGSLSSADNVLHAVETD